MPREINSKTQSISVLQLKNFIYFYLMFLNTNKHSQRTRKMSIAIDYTRTCFQKLELSRYRHIRHSFGCLFYYCTIHLYLAMLFTIHRSMGYFIGIPWVSHITDDFHALLWFYDHQI